MQTRHFAPAGGACHPGGGGHLTRRRRASYRCTAPSATGACSGVSEACIRQDVMAAAQLGRSACVPLRPGDRCGPRDGVGRVCSLTGRCVPAAEAARPQRRVPRPPTGLVAAAVPVQWPPFAWRGGAAATAAAEGARWIDAGAVQGITYHKPAWREQRTQHKTGSSFRRRRRASCGAEGGPAFPLPCRQSSSTRYPGPSTAQAP
jgi:hypothetical protein